MPDRTFWERFGGCISGGLVAMLRILVRPIQSKILMERLCESDMPPMHA